MTVLQGGCLALAAADEHHVLHERGGARRKPHSQRERSRQRHSRKPFSGLHIPLSFLGWIKFVVDEPFRTVVSLADTHAPRNGKFEKSGEPDAPA